MLSPQKEREHRHQWPPGPLSPQVCWFADKRAPDGTLTAEMPHWEHQAWMRPIWLHIIPSQSVSIIAQPMSIIGQIWLRFVNSLVHDLSPKVKVETLWPLELGPWASSLKSDFNEIVAQTLIFHLRSKLTEPRKPKQPRFADYIIICIKS